MNLPPASPRPAATGRRYAHYVLFVLVLVYVCNFVDRLIISILAEDIKAELHVSDSQLGFIAGTAFAVFYALFGLPLGRLADIWIRKRLIAIGLALWSALTVLSGTAASFLQLAVYRCGVGIGESAACRNSFAAGNPQLRHCPQIQNLVQVLPRQQALLDNELLDRQSGRDRFLRQGGRFGVANPGRQRGHQRGTPLQPVHRLFFIGGDASDTGTVELPSGVGQNLDREDRVVGDDRHHDVELELTRFGRQRYRGIAA